MAGMKREVLVLAALFTTIQVSHVEARGKRYRECRQVGGTISASFVPLEEGQAIVGTVTGSLSGAIHGIASAPTPQENGSLILEVKDHFVTEEGLVLETLDQVTLVPVPGLEGVFHQSATYEVVGGTGHLSHASGSLTGHGEVDLNRGQVTVRYEGEICED